MSQVYSTQLCSVQFSSVLCQCFTSTGNIATRVVCANALSNGITSGSWLSFTSKREWNIQWSAPSSFISPKVQLHVKCGKQLFSFRYTWNLFSRLFRICSDFHHLNIIIIVCTNTHTQIERHKPCSKTHSTNSLTLLKYAYWILRFPLATTINPST